MSHVKEQDLALYAADDLGWLSRLSISRHVRACPACAEAVEDYRAITADLALCEPQIPDWDNLAAEMRANIRLGLEAGACVQAPVAESAFSGFTAWFSPRVTVAMASLMILLGAGIALRPAHPGPAPQVLLSQQSVSQQSVKVDTEGVTITNVFAE